MAKERASWKRDGGMGGREARGQVEEEEEVEETASHHWVACTGERERGKVSLTRPSQRALITDVFLSPPYLGQRGQQPLRVVQRGPAVGQTVGHVSQLLPHWRKSDLDLAQACPVQLAPALQLIEQ